MENSPYPSLAEGGGGWGPPLKKGGEGGCVTGGAGRKAYDSAYGGKVPFSQEALPRRLLPSQMVSPGDSNSGLHGCVNRAAAGILTPGHPVAGH
jgi:hypothetical protein